MIFWEPSRWSFLFNVCGKVDKQLFTVQAKTTGNMFSRFEENIQRVRGPFCSSCSLMFLNDTMFAMMNMPVEFVKPNT